MSKRLSLLLIISLFSLWVHAQWTTQDSLALLRALEYDGEIKLNMDAVKGIDYDNFVGKQIMADDRPALEFDATLPKVFPDRNKMKLTLRPYTATTRFNYDPIYQRKIKVDAHTWKKDQFGHLTMRLVYDDWAKTPFEAGLRKSLEEIEATGLRYNPLGERANNMAVGSWSGSGGGISGSFMDPFTKDFWDVKGKRRKARTLEVLKNYGDSTSIYVNEEIKKAVIH